MNWTGLAACLSAEVPKSLIADIKIPCLPILTFMDIELSVIAKLSIFI
jgi:hypothetical protein